MRILYGITKSNFGGAQRYVFDLALASKKAGHEVAVVTGGEGILTKKLKSENIKIFSLETLGRDVSPLNDIRSIFLIMNVLQEWRPDVFHTNSSKMGLIGGLAGRIMRVPRMIFTTHGWAFNELRPWYQKAGLKLLYWKILLLSHKTICVSLGTKSQVAKWPFVQKKLALIKNGIEEFKLLPRNEARRELGVHRDDVLVVGAVSELHHIKGLDVLLLAWSDFARSTQTELIIIGEGEERQYLENMAQNLGISDTVVFKGFVDNARGLLKAFDIFVLPSRSEAMPYALLEAGTAGLPTIATSVGGIPEVVENGIGGALIPPNDPDALFSSLRLFYENPRMRDRLGQILREAVKEKFSRKKMLEETLALYQ